MTFSVTRDWLNLHHNDPGAEQQDLVWPTGTYMTILPQPSSTHLVEAESCSLGSEIRRRLLRDIDFADTELRKQLIFPPNNDSA